MFGVVIVDCIDHIYEGDKTYSTKDSTQKELKDFLKTCRTKGIFRN